MTRSFFMAHCLNPMLLIQSGYYDNNNVFHCFYDATQGKNIIDKLGKKHLNYKFYVKQQILNVRNILNTFGNEYYINFVNDLRKDKSKRVLEIPCRKCSSCLLNKKEEWLIRNQLELENYDENNCSFLTLTYNDNGLFYTDNGIVSLHYEDLQDFFKRLRKHFPKRKIKYYIANEYGDTTFRPHYHVILYGLGLDDFRTKGSVIFYSSRNGYNLYICNFLQDIWYRREEGKKIMLGDIKVGSVTHDSLSYTTGYCTKKLKNDYFDYTGIEFNKNVMSRVPGIGMKYFSENKDNIYKFDTMLFKKKHKVQVIKPVKYFDRLYEKEDNDSFVMLKQKRISNFDFLDWYNRLDTNLNYADYMRNLDNLQKRQYWRKEVEI